MDKTMEEALQHLLNKVNRITSKFRHGLKENISDNDFEMLVEAQIRYEAENEKLAIIADQPKGSSATETEFTCECKKAKGWIAEGRITEPCPECNRRYEGVYSDTDLTVIGVEIVDHPIQKSCDGCEHEKNKGVCIDCSNYSHYQARK